MDEKPKSEKKPPETRSRSKTLRRIGAGLLTALLIVLALLVFVFRDRLTGEGLRETFGKNAPAELTDETYTYETGSGQVFAPVGDGLAVASSSAVQLLDEQGETVFKQIVSYGAPAAFGADKAALFCDIGGTGCIYVTAAGESTAVKPEGEILSASISAAGWFTLITEEAGYKGLVSVYNTACELQYRWWSGSGYALKAALSPNSRTLAVLTADMEGGYVRFFRLTSETELASAFYADELLYDLYFMENDTVCAVGQAAVRFLGTDGAERGSYLFGDSYLMDYDLGSRDFAALFVSDYRTGERGRLITLDSAGNVLGTAETERNVTSLSARGRQLLVMTSGDLSLYSDSLVRQYSNETLMTARRAILRAKGDILLLGAYSAERFSF